jgi:hypothetical protein
MNDQLSLSKEARLAPRFPLVFGRRFFLVVKQSENKQEPSALFFTSHPPL